MTAGFRNVEIRRRIRAALDIELGPFWELDGWHRLSWGWRLEAHYPIRWPTRHVVVGLCIDDGTWSVREPAAARDDRYTKLTLDGTRGWPERLGREIAQAVRTVAGADR